MGRSIRNKCSRASVGDELEADLRRLELDGSVQAGGVTDREGAGEGDSSGPEVVQVGRVQEQSVGVQDVGAVALKQTESENTFLFLFGHMTK